VKRATKAALMSAFVCPGAGHLYLNKKPLGFALVCISLIAFSILVFHAITIATEISNQIVEAGIIPNASELRESINSKLYQSGSKQITFATNTLIIIWIVSIVDSYRLASKEKKIHND